MLSITLTTTMGPGIRVDPRRSARRDHARRPARPQPTRRRGDDEPDERRRSRSRAGRDSRRDRRSPSCLHNCCPRPSAGPGQKSGAGGARISPSSSEPACVRAFSFPERRANDMNKRTESSSGRGDRRPSSSDAEAIFAVDYRGISVPQAAELRAELREADATLPGRQEPARAARRRRGRHRRARRAASSGPTALTFVKGDAALAAKAISDFGREHDVLELQGRADGRRGARPRQLQGDRQACPASTCCTASSSASSPARSPAWSRGLGSLISGLGRRSSARSPSRAWSPARRPPPRPRRPRPRRRPPPRPRRPRPRTSRRPRRRPAEEPEAEEAEPSRRGAGRGGRHRRGAEREPAEEAGDDDRGATSEDSERDSDDKEDEYRWRPSDHRGLDRGAEGHLGARALRAHQGARGGVRRLGDRGRGRRPGRRRRRRRRRRPRRSRPRSTSS